MSILEYDAVGHRYSVNGVEIPSVTRVIGDVLAGDRRWSDEAAMWRGSVVHKVCELDDRGTLDEATVDPAAAGYLAAWRRFKDEMRPAFVEIEEAHANEDHRFAGRPDRRALMLAKHTTIDIKTGAVGAITGIQLAAYCGLNGCTERVAVAIGVDGRYTLTTYNARDLRRDYQVFLAALAVWNWRKERRLL